MTATVGQRFHHLLTAEWIKLSSLRSTRWAAMIGAAAIVGVNLGAAFATHSPNDADARFAAFTDVASQIVMLTAGSLGAVMIVSEFSTGLIRATFTAVPHRRAVMAAKVVVLAAVMTGYGLVVSLASFAATRAVLSGRGAGLSPVDPRAAQVVVASTLFVPVCALVGLAVGSVLRHSASSVVGTVFVLMLLPFLVAHRNVWTGMIERSLPHSAWYRLSAQQLAGPMEGVHTTYGAAWTVYAAWAVAAAAIAVVAVNRRDV